MAAASEICGFYDIKPQFFGQGKLRVTNSAEFGKQQRYWDGFTFNANGRLPKGIRVGGGIDTDARSTITATRSTFRTSRPA